MVPRIDRLTVEPHNAPQRRRHLQSLASSDRSTQDAGRSWLHRPPRPSPSTYAATQRDSFIDEPGGQSFASATWRSRAPSAARLCQPLLHHCRLKQDEDDQRQSQLSLRNRSSKTHLIPRTAPGTQAAPLLSLRSRPVTSVRRRFFSIWQALDNNTNGAGGAGFNFARS